MTILKNHKAIDVFDASQVLDDDTFVTVTRDHVTGKLAVNTIVLDDGYNVGVHVCNADDVHLYNVRFRRGLSVVSGRIRSDAKQDVWAATSSQYPLFKSYTIKGALRVDASILGARYATISRAVGSNVVDIDIAFPVR